MKKNEKIEIYFGKNGVTSTSANYVANVAKELIRAEQADLDNVDFITTNMCTAAINSMHTIKTGCDEAELLALPQKIERIAQMKSLIGWLREGIKAKEQMLRDVQNMCDSNVLKKIGYEKQERRAYLTEYTEDEYIETLPEQEQRTIQLLNTKAAIYGKAIHDNGPVGKARQRVIDCKHAPAVIERTMGTLTIAENAPTVAVEKVDEVYFELQDKYRTVQKELNSHLFKIKDELHHLNLDITAYNTDVQKENDAADKAERDAIMTWRKKESKRIADLKIVIPQELRALYDEVNNA